MQCTNSQLASLSSHGRTISIIRNNYFSTHTVLVLQMTSNQQHSKTYSRGRSLNATDTDDAASLHKPNT